jgi:hypothetical protein
MHVYLWMLALLLNTAHHRFVSANGLVEATMSKDVHSRLASCGIPDIETHPILIAILLIFSSVLAVIILLKILSNRRYNRLYGSWQCNHDSKEPSAPGHAWQRPRMNKALVEPGPPLW